MAYVTSPIRVSAATIAIAIGLISLTACGGSKTPLATPVASTSASASTAAVTSDVTTNATSDATDATSDTPLSPASGSTASSSVAASSTGPATTGPAPSSSGPAGGTSGGGAKCSDLSDAAASAALGKKVTIKAEPATSLAGLTICDVTIANEVYPVQLDVDSANASALFAADQQVSSVAAIAGLGDKAFRSSIGVEALSGGVDIKAIGPAGPVLSNNFTVPTALVKAMIAAIR